LFRAEAVERRGSSIDDYTAPDGDGSMQERLQVYQRTGEPCPRCGRAIKRIVIGARSTHFCSWCQRLGAADRKAARAILRTMTGGRRRTGGRWTELAGEGSLGLTPDEAAAAATRARTERTKRAAATRRAAAGASAPAEVAAAPADLVVVNGRHPLLLSGTEPVVPFDLVPRPSASAPPAALSPVAPEPAVRREFHVQLDHAQLPGDPVAAQGWLDTVRRRIERQAAGAFTVVDDASASWLKGCQHYVRVALEDRPGARAEISRLGGPLRGQERMAVPLGLLDDRLGARVIGKREAA